MNNHSMTRPTLGVIAVLGVSGVLGFSGCGTTSAPTPARGGDEVPATGGGLDVEVLRESWMLYLQRSPEWPAARESWIASGEKARGILLDNLFREMSRITDTMELDQGVMPRWERARREMDYLRSDAIPFLMVALKMFAERSRQDPVMVDRLTLALADLDAFEEISAIVNDPAQDERLRTYALQAMLKAEDPRSADLLARLVRKEDSWQLRGLAVKGLGVIKDSTPVVRAALIAAMRDPDRFVRERACDALASHAREHPDVQSALIEATRDPDRSMRGKAVRGLSKVRSRPVRTCLVDCYAMALQAGDRALAEFIHEALQFNTGQIIEAGSVRAWREWLAREGEG